MMNSQFDRLFASACLSALAVYAFVTHTHFFDLDLVVAWRGFSVVDFSNSVLYPQNFARDYPGGAAFIGNSAMPWLYPFAVSYLDIAPLSMMYIVIACEIVLLIGGAALILRVLFADVPAYAVVLLAALFLASAARQVDLARFSTPFLVGQFYVVADMLRLAALCALLTRRYAVMALLLMAGFAVHLSMTALALPVLLGAFLVSGSEARRAAPWVSAGAFVVFAVAWFFWFVAPQALSGAHIPRDVWFQFGRLLNSHWYLADMNMILPRPERVLLPFMGLVLIGLAALARTPEIGALRRTQLLVMIALIYLASGLGLIAAEQEWSMTLQKIAPQRLSAMAAIILLPVIVFRLFADLRSSAYGHALLALAVLASTMLQGHPYPVALAGLYALPVLAVWFRRPRLGETGFAVALAALGPALLLILHWNAGYRLDLEAYLGPLWCFAVALAGLVIVAASAMRQSSAPPEDRALRKALSSAAVLGFLSLSYLWMADRYALDEARRTVSQDYKAVQLWARDTTEPTALFLADPCLAYGWRDFSQRSSWGSIQEFLKTSWLYSGSLTHFEEGLARTERLGIDPLALRRKGGVSNRMDRRAACGIARDVVYALEPDWIDAMVRDYGIDYFVLLKEQARDGARIMPVFENGSFFVLSTADLARP